MLCVDIGGLLARNRHTVLTLGYGFELATVNLPLIKSKTAFRLQFSSSSFNLKKHYRFERKTTMSRDIGTVYIVLAVAM